jgi:superfamily II DNA helicase RecQ
VPAYVVFRDATLVALASLRPTSISGLLDVSGIGPTKAELYGDDVLQLVAKHAEAV